MYQQPARHAAKPLTRPSIRIGFFIFICAVLFAAIGCDRQPENPSPVIVPVHVATVRSVAKGAQTSFSGVLVPRVESQLAFRVPGRIVERSADTGMRVGKGDVLARLDETPFKLAIQEARAALAQAQTTLAQIQRDVERHRSLARSGVIPGADFDALETRHANAQAQVRAMQSRLARVRNDLAYATLTAPAAGTIAQVQAEAGQVVTAGTPVLRLARAGEYEVQVDVPESQIGMIALARPAKVRLLSLPGTELAGTVREAASVADPATRTYRVRVALPGLPDSARLGMTASVHFDGAADGHVQLPITALFQQGDQPAIWVLPNNAQHLVLRPISLAGMSTDTITIASGIAAGERVVIAGVHRLDAGMTVKAWDGRLP